MVREAQEELWKRRIRDIQVLSIIVMVSFSKVSGDSKKWRLVADK